MKNILLSGAAALLATVSANADTLIHITGSTAFRASTVNAIQNLMGAGNFKAAFQSSSGANTGASNRCVIQGTIPSLASAGVVTVKCSWSGSTGGIKTLVQNIDVTTWMSVTNLPASGSTGLADASISYSLDTTPFPGETAKADVTMEDSAQASTGFVTSTLTETPVGVLVFEFVANNGSPAGVDNITPLLAQAVLSGGVPLSQFTGNSADGTAVYAVGRDFDSGTRLSCLAETGVGVFGGVQHIQGIFNGTQGTAGSSVASIKLYQAETVLGQSFPIGQSGYPSGSFVADFLATPGSSTANTTTGIPVAEQVGHGAGHLIGYLGRSDAARACKTVAFPSSTAHRLKFNGVPIVTVAIDGTTGAPVGNAYNDVAVREGLYQLWEYERLAYRSTLAVDKKAVADAIATRVINFDYVANGLKLSDMSVSKAIEGGVITH